MAELPFLPIATDALLADAGDLPNELFGAYCRLLFRWWREGAQPEQNEKRLARWAGLSSDDFDDLKEFLTETDDGWIQKRLAETFAKIQRKSAKAKEAAAKRWECERNADASENECERISERNANHNQSSLSKDKQIISGEDAPPKKVLRGTRLTDDWRPPPDYIAFALTEGFSEAEAYREADRFRDYWISKTGQQARKADWLATWRNWCRNSKDKRSGASGPSGGTGGRNGGHADPVRIRNQLIRELTPEDDVSTDGRQLQRAGWR